MYGIRVKVTTKNLEETYKLAQNFILEFIDTCLAGRQEAPLPPRRNGAFVVLLKGDLGSGKTSFVQGVARALGVTEHVTSPTFVILKNYKIFSRPDLKSSKGLAFENLVHMDAYRLEEEKDLEALDWDKLVLDPQNIMLVEWPEKVGLTKYPTIKFTFIDETTRQIELPLK